MTKGRTTFELSHDTASAVQTAIDALALASTWEREGSYVQGAIDRRRDQTLPLRKRMAFGARRGSSGRLTSTTAPR